MLNELKANNSAHPEVRALLEKLRSRFGPLLEVLGADNEWVTVRVRGLTEMNLIRMLEREQFELLGSERWRFQVVCAQNGRQPGVSIRFLETAGSQSAVASGFWYY
jgi:hypothetical protein